MNVLMHTGAGCYITAFGWPQLMHGCVTINRKRTWRLVCPCVCDACAACLLLLSSTSALDLMSKPTQDPYCSLGPECTNVCILYFFLKISYWDFVCMANYIHFNEMLCDLFLKNLVMIDILRLGAFFYVVSSLLVSLCNPKCSV